MLPGGLDPRKMQKIMKQMGISSKEIPAKRVIIEMEDGRYIINNPQVTEVNMQGSKSYQIAGEATFEEDINEEDIKIITEQTGCTIEEAKSALEKTNGDIAEAILSLKGES